MIRSRPSCAEIDSGEQARPLPVSGPRFRPETFAENYGSTNRSRDLSVQLFSFALADGLDRITGPKNAFAIPLIAWRFQAAIIVWWTPCWAASSATASGLPRIVSSVTFAWMSAL